MKFKISGASDDIVDIEGDVRGECDIYAQPICLIKVGDEKRCTLVQMEYAPKVQIKGAGVWAAPCWVATILPLDEHLPMHPCTIALGGHGYSTEVTFDVPDGTQVVWRHKDSDGWEIPS